MDCPLAATSRSRRVGDLPALDTDSGAHQLTLERTKTGITVKIHGSPWDVSD